MADNYPKLTETRKLRPCACCRIPTVFRSAEGSPYCPGCNLACRTE